MFQDDDGTPVFVDRDDAEEVWVNPDTERLAEASLAVIHALRSGFTAQELDGYETLASGQADDLKYESADGIRYYLSRTGVADGEPFENTITVEVQAAGRWEVVAKYDGGEIDDEAEEPMGVMSDADEERAEADLKRIREQENGKFSVEIEYGNAAMETGYDVADALAEVSQQINDGEPSEWNGEGTVRDRNGNTVGRWTFHDHN